MSPSAVLPELPLAAARPVPPWRARARGLFALTRPSVVGLVFFTGVPALAIDNGRFPPWRLSAAILAGVALCAAASSVFNAWIERDLDAKMERTRNRPLPTGLVTARQALIWAWLLTLAGGATLWASGGFAGMTAGVATIAFYVFVYTIWLKPRTPLNIVIGGAAGAAPPLIVDAALHGGIGLQSLSMFTLVFLWTPPHFWAISLFRAADYANAGLPMLPLTHGSAHTRLRIVQYAISMTPFAILPAVTRHLSIGYGAFALVVSLWFIWMCMRLWQDGTESRARKVFAASLVHLHAIFAAMTVDLLIR